MPQRDPVRSKVMTVVGWRVGQPMVASELWLEAEPLTVPGLTQAAIRLMEVAVLVQKSAGWWMP